MNEDEEIQAVYDEVCRVIGRTVVILKETQQPVTMDSIKLMLQVYSIQNDDVYLSRIYAVAKDIMEKKSVKWVI
ncbi:DUF2767 family protein [Salmonella enterica subsp. enterica serovar Muenchen]|nr:DUF2767 family protein [Salmonella enterica subsp. enterica serovar Muenchen]EDQ9741369.1 DUF2767 family protein [Salmonella enterica subsp. enterica serovar Oranienburg]EEO7308617.1 DUF2767 family protein [Salmonella enterica]ECZ5457895.1 DUF2767 family protein [Salmonella enterica subsp. enterica serovar Muenchen]EDG8466767.1 DUF2767 family protein [Salmonella enterica subsp. enterica serovar Muenchen]